MREGKTRVTYANKEQIRILNEEAVKSNRNRALVDEAFDHMDDDVIYPVVYHFLRNDVEVRATFWGPRIGSFTIDMPIELFMQLDSMTIPNNKLSFDQLA